jgi:hypothetical protein
MKLNDIKKELKMMSRDELCEIILDLYQLNYAVKDFLSYHLNPSENNILDIYKIKIKKAFDVDKIKKVSLAKGKKTLSDFKKIGGSTEQQILLMLFYVDEGINLIIKFNHFTASLINSILSVYQATLTLIQSSYLLDYFKEAAWEPINKLTNLDFDWKPKFEEYFNSYYS